MGYEIPEPTPQAEPLAHAHSHSERGRPVVYNAPPVPSPGPPAMSIGELAPHDHHRDPYSPERGYGSEGEWRHHEDDGRGVLEEGNDVTEYYLDSWNSKLPLT